MEPGRALSWAATGRGTDCDPPMINTSMAGGTRTATSVYVCVCVWGGGGVQESQVLTSSSLYNVSDMHSLIKITTAVRKGSCVLIQCPFKMFPV